MSTIMISTMAVTMLSTKVLGTTHSVAPALRSGHSSISSTRATARAARTLSTSSNPIAIRLCCRSSKASIKLDSDVSHCHRRASLAPRKSQRNS